MKTYDKCMTIDQFYKYISNNLCEDYIVRLAYKYSHSREDYYISNEVCSVDMSGNIIWFNDWDEGQDDIKVIAWCPVDCAFNAWLERDDGYGT